MVHFGVRQQHATDEDEVEDGNKAPSIEVKLTVPTCHRPEVLINFEIRNELETAGALFNADLPLPLFPSAQAMYEDEILEAVFKIRYGEPHQTVREASINFAQRWCDTVGHGLHEAVRLEFMSPDSYFLPCVPEHCGINIYSFSFGTFRNYGVFDRHFQVQRGDEVLKPICLDFEHDCKRMDLYSLYEMLVPIPGDHQRTRSTMMMSRMTFQYSSIHSIVVDYCGDYDDAPTPRSGFTKTEVGPSTVIYFRLKYPPKIHAGFAKTNTGRKQMIKSTTYYDACVVNRRFNFYERVRELLDCPSEVIGKCNVLKVILSPWQQNQPGDPRNAAVEWHNTVNEIISRVKSRSNCRVYFTGIRTNPTAAKEIGVSDNCFPSYKCLYLLKALMHTRPFNIQNQINDTFLRYLRECIKQNERAAETALSQLLAAADENRYFSVLSAFRKVFEVYSNEAASSSQNDPPPTKNPKRSDNAGAPLDDVEFVGKNCVKVRKLVITPTREMLLAPEVIVSNRILRNFGEEYALRVVIRDEDGSKIQGSRMKSEILKKWLEDLMRNDYAIGPRHYRFLGWSNSQLRDHAFYMYAKTAKGEDIPAIRKWMGSFKDIKNVPKMMSRMGQCFTQAQTSIPLKGGEIALEDDVCGGDINPLTNERYVFSDGIGRISYKCAEEVCEKLGVVPVRSAYQMRYQGSKGMLSVDKTLDANPNGPKVMLRKSMRKFESDTCEMLEIVKYSQPSPVYLNRPFVMILDQVSEKSFRSRQQYHPCSTGAPGAAFLSEDVHRRVCNRIHELLDEELFNMADMLLEENASATALTTRTTLSIDFKALKNAGFTLTTEPFFRGLLLAIHQYTIKQQLWKQKIEVPLSLGRTMYGIMDTTKLLQYGQVFVQYSRDIGNPGENLIILEGDIMATKNPCIVPGDVRILKAVDIPFLHHMYDVIVFPQNGPRPHTDEMAGSDLDGDEYSVYWDPNLMFDPKQVQSPMNFPKNKPTDVNGDLKDDHMIEFFHDYLQQDSIGQVSNAHLAFADKEGIFSDKAMALAMKCSMAVDFPKTGVPADALTDEERPYHWPDFFEKYHQPMYRSQRLVGKLYRRVKNASDIIRLGQDSISRPSADRCYFDPHLEVTGWEYYKDDAAAARDQYSQFLQMLLDLYGVTDEASLISGHMVTIRNRLSDGEKEDFSFFNTEKIIEWRITKIFQIFRQRFFAEFGGENEQVLEQPPDQMEKKASAWYMVTYGQQQSMRGRVMLSFPWMIWEVLRKIKQRRTFGVTQMEHRLIDPTAELLDRTIQEYGNRCEEEAERLISIITNAESGSPDKIVSFYLQAYKPDFKHLLAVVLHWADKEMGFEREHSLKPIYLALLLVEFCLQHQYLEKKAAIENQPTGQLPRERRLPCKGEVLLGYLKYLASFKHRDSIESKICDDQATINLRRRQLRYVGQVAFKTYHHVAWTSRFDSLRLQNESRMARAALNWDREEMEPITVVINGEITQTMTPEEVAKRLKQWSGVDDVFIRRKTVRDSSEFFVTAAGTLETRQALHDVLLSDKLHECLKSAENKNPLLEEEI